MIAKHVLIGGFFTLVGVVSLFVPAIPFICIGALIFGPIELVYGLFGREGVPTSPEQVRAGIPAEGPPFEVATERTFDGAYARVVARTPAVHVVHAAYVGPKASVLLDGRVVAGVKRGYISKQAHDVDVPLDGESGKVLTVRFWGRMKPQIDLLLDGSVIGQI